MPAGSGSRSSAGHVRALLVGALSSWRCHAPPGVKDAILTYACRNGFGVPPATTASGIARGRRVHPVWWLARKELHLQELTFVVAGLYLLGWVVILRRGAVLGGTLDQPLLIWTVMFGGVEALLSGSLASAEESDNSGPSRLRCFFRWRQRKQWAVKVGVALGLTLSLAVGLPFLLASLSPTAGGLRVNLSFVGTAHHPDRRQPLRVIALHQRSESVAAVASGLSSHGRIAQSPRG